MNTNNRLAALEGLRGYASLLVFLVHSFGLLTVLLYGINPEQHDVAADDHVGRILLILLHRSHYGVDLFFVLSGLLMVDLSIERWPGTLTFLRRRLLRIYPAYALSSLIFAGVAASWFSGQFSVQQALGNLLLLQGFFVLKIAPINPVTWSLSFEMVFYLFTPILALAWSNKRPALNMTSFTLLPAGLALLILLPALVDIQGAIYLAYFALFMPGIAIGVMTDQMRENLARRISTSLVILIWIGFTLSVKSGLLLNSAPLYYLVSAIACGSVVLKMFDPDCMLTIGLSSRVARWIGKHSYSLFLIHYIVIHSWAAIVRQLVPIERVVGFSILFLCGSLVFSLIAARLLYLIAEQMYFKKR